MPDNHQISSKVKHYTVEDFVLDRQFRDWVLSPDTAANLLWEEWIANHLYKVDEVREARELILGMSRVKYTATPQDRAEVFFNVMDAVEQKKHESKVIPLGPNSILNKYPSKKAKRLPLWLYKVAAAIIVTIGAGGFLYQSQFDPSELSSNRLIEKSNPRGQKSTVFLPDGSKVFLNSESKITYTTDFDVERRVLRLSGEAFFEVVKNPEKPFVVKTGDLAIVALGTSFNINSFSNLTEVQLMTGKVRVESGKDTRLEEFLLPGQSLAYNQKDRVLERGTFDTEVSALWRKGIIYFDDTPFNEVIDVLGRWYDVKFHISNMPDPHMICSGKFEKDYLSTVLGSLSYTLNFKYEIDGKEVYLQFNQPN